MFTVGLHHVIVRTVDEQGEGRAYPITTSFSLSLTFLYVISVSTPNSLAVGRTNASVSETCYHHTNVLMNVRI